MASKHLPRRTKTESGLEKRLASSGSRQKITKTTHADRGHETIWEISAKALSKLFRNVPSLTQERMSPWLFGSAVWFSSTCGAGGREAEAERRPTGVPHRKPRRHGWFADGFFSGFFNVSFPAAGEAFNSFCFLTLPGGSGRHRSCLPRYTICTRPSRSVLTITFRRTRLNASWRLSN